MKVLLVSNNGTLDLLFYVPRFKAFLQATLILKDPKSIIINWTPWPEPANEPYPPSKRHLSVNLVPTFADRGCHAVSVTDPYGRIFGFLDRSFYFFFQAAPQLYSRGWVDPVPDPLLLRKSGSAEKRTPGRWICSQELWPLDHRGGQVNNNISVKFPPFLVILTYDKIRWYKNNFMGLHSTIRIIRWSASGHCGRLWAASLLQLPSPLF
jgi:hypothetical protein